MPEQETTPKGIKYKLANLEEFLPDQPEHIYEFGRFLSERSTDGLEPEGFDLMVSLAIYDLQRGEDGYTGEPIKGTTLVGLSPIIYTLFQMQADIIKRILYGEEDTNQ